MEDLRFEGDFFTQGDKVAILKFVNENEDWIRNPEFSKLMYHHNTRLQIISSKYGELKVTKSVSNGETYLYYCFVYLNENENNKKSQLKSKNMCANEIIEAAYLAGFEPLDDTSPEDLEKEAIDFLINEMKE